MFTVVGEALLDMVQPTAGEVYRALPAGGPLNIAVALRRLGHPTAMMARFSSGPLGDRVRRYAQDSGLDLSACVVTDRQATLAFATVDEHGRASYDFYVTDTADWGWTDDELDALPGSTQVVHTGSLATVVEPGAGRIAAWWRRLADDGGMVLSFDPNVRPALAGARDHAVRRVEQLVASSHVVKASDEDLGWLYPGVDPVDSLRRWVALGPAFAVLTLGPRGCVAATSPATLVEVSAPRIDVVDTIGAGDSFQAGLLSGLAAVGRLAPDAVRTLVPAEVEAVLRQATAVAALTCGRPGADPPTRQEYDVYAGAIAVRGEAS